MRYGVGRPDDDLEPTPLPPGTASQLQVTSNVFRIEATGEVPGQGKRTLFAIVERASAQGGVAKVNVKNWRWLGEDDRHQ